MYFLNQIQKHFCGRRKLQTVDWLKPCTPWGISWKLGLVHNLTCLSEWSLYLSVESFTHSGSRSISYYKRAADLGDKRAAQRLKSSSITPLHQPGGPGSVIHRDGPDSMSTLGKGGKDKDCIIM